MRQRSSGITAAALAVALVAQGCDGTEEEAVPGPDLGAPVGAATAEPGAPAVTPAGADVPPGAGLVRVADITGNLDRFAGQTVTVDADLEEVLSSYAFTLDEDAVAAGGIENELMVFSPKSAQLASIDDQCLNDRVRVSGKVNRKSTG